MKVSKSVHVLLSAFLLASCFQVQSFHIYASDVLDVKNQNLALSKKVVASHEYPSLPAKYLTDNDETSRWSSERAPVQWVYVDLGDTYKMNYFSMIWESQEVYASDYNIYVSQDVSQWGNPVISRVSNQSQKSIETLKEPVVGRYVKLEITKQAGYPSVSCRDFQVMYVSDEIAPQDPTENIALNCQGNSSSNETSSLHANKAFDGDTSSRISRWSSDVKNAPHWLSVDLNGIRNIKTIRLFWETRKATHYKIQTSQNGTDWKTVKDIPNRPRLKTDKIVLDEVEQARYVRVYIESATSTDPDGGVEWNTVSLYEMEVYGGEIEDSQEEIADQIMIEDVKKGDKTLKITYPTNQQYDFQYNGTDYEQVIDQDLNIYQPIVDTVVKVSFKITNKKTKEYTFKEKSITIPGLYQKEKEDNKAPVVLPELREWKGMKGNFQLNSQSRLLYDHDNLKTAAKEMALDYKDLTGQSIEVIKSTSPQKGDIYLTKTNDQSLGLDDEGYLMEIDDYVKISSYTQTGSYWGTRTVLQGLKQTNYKTLPKGIARDYPLYKVRGFILDVGRKTFHLDYLKQIVKEMSWYKMNDFQIHLNDNLIPLEYYSQNGMDPLDAYSAFRLESNIKKGGNNGLNKADLTSTDMFYTKDEFREFIKTSRELGVHIIPEIDTPAHSLALTKVRPDLRNGTYGRENDHLNLVSKYDESLAFVQSIFGEYMTENNPVFDLQTTVHIGADEYHASSKAYRKFVNDMIEYVETSGRKARVWGSFTQASQGEKINADGVEINLWNFGYANMDQMYEDGFDLINCNDGNYYIVPNAGYYYDYLNESTMYNLAINSIGGVTIPAGDQQMKGGAFAVWNDMTDYLDNGVSEYDVYDRIEKSLPLFAAKLWGKGELSLSEAKKVSDNAGDAPRTNFGYQVDIDTDDYLHIPMDTLKDTTNHYRVEEGKNSSLVTQDGKTVLELKGNTSYIKTNLETVGLNNDLRVKVKRQSDSQEEQILFESDYGSIKAVQKDTGKVGMSREGFDYSFDYTLPVNEWVELELKNKQNQIQLYVNGQLIDTLGDDERIEGRPMLATNMFPLARIGSIHHAFIGYVDDIRLGKQKDFVSSMELDHIYANAIAIMNQDNKNELQPLINEAQILFQKYELDEKEVTTLIQKFQKVLDKLDYRKADYSRVQAYLKLTEHLDTFTNQSIKTLQQVISSIRYDLPIQLQATVDAYEQALSKALSQLVLKQEKDRTYVDNSTITATASSYQRDGSDPKNVLDNDNSTIWHTDWTNTTMPHWIDLELEEKTLIDGISYTPRQTGSNGNLLEYEIQISDDGKIYQTHAKGTLPNNNQEKHIDFKKVLTKHVRLVYVKSVQNFGSAASIKVSLVNMNTDKAGLKEIIDYVSSLENTHYHQESWHQLETTIQKAKQLLENPNADANDVETMKQDLLKALISLRLDPKVIDKTLLLEKIEEVKSLNKDLYLHDSYKQLLISLEQALVVYENQQATLLEVEQVIDLLNQSLLSLEYKPADYTKVDEAIEKANQLNKEDYKDFHLVEKAISLVDRNMNITEQDKVDLMAKAIEDAIACLEKKDIPQDEDILEDSTNQPSIDVKPIEPGDNTQNNDAIVPQTGDMTSTGVYALLIVLSSCLLFVLKRKQS